MSVLLLSEPHHIYISRSEIQPGGRKCQKQTNKKGKQKFVLVINQHEKNLLTFNKLQVDVGNTRFQSGIQSGIQS